MADYQLVVINKDINDPDYDRLQALPPAMATAIAIPTARVLASLPVTGSSAGELVFDSTSGVSYIWTGANWNAIISDFMHTFADDATLLGSTIPNGHIAISEATGNFFISTAPGWRQFGIREYTTVTGLLADNPAPGSIGVALDEHSIWMREAADWMCISLRQLPDFAAVVAWTPVDGSACINVQTGLRYARVAGAWEPQGIWNVDEATLLAGMDHVDGQIAVATDTGHIYTFDEANQAWLGSQIRFYPDETTLQADTPNNGVLGLAGDTGLVYARYNGIWTRVNSPTMSVTDVAPANPAAGDIQFAPTTGTTSIYDGVTWRPVGGAPTGTVIMHASITPPAGYLLCDGSPIPAGPQYDALRNMIGPNTPDLRTMFPRMASTQAEIDGFTRHNDTTRRPRTNFTVNASGNTSSNGQHGHRGDYWYKASGANGEALVGWTGKAGGPSGNNATHNVTNIVAPDGNHNHSVTVNGTVNGGGDAETAPRHSYLAFHIAY